MKILSPQFLLMRAFLVSDLILDATPGVVVALAAVFAVTNGSLYGLVGAAIGYLISRTKATADQSDKSG
jgi:hypothetical protein